MSSKRTLRTRGLESTTVSVTKTTSASILVNPLTYTFEDLTQDHALFIEQKGLYTTSEDQGIATITVNWGDVTLSADFIFKPRTDYTLSISTEFLQNTAILDLRAVSPTGETFTRSVKKFTKVTGSILDVILTTTSEWNTDYLHQSTVITTGAEAGIGNTGPSTPPEQVGSKAELRTVTLSGPSGTIDLGNIFTISHFSATTPGRFRLYRDTASRDADAHRQLGQKIATGIGLVLEIDATVKLSGLISPQETAMPGQSNPAWLWTGAGTVTLELISMEL